MDRRPGVGHFLRAGRVAAGLTGRKVHSLTGIDPGSGALRALRADMRRGDLPDLDLAAIERGP